MYFEYLLIILLSISLILFFGATQSQLRKIRKLESEEERKEDELKDRAEKIIHEANERAMRLIEDAHMNAEKIQKELDEKLDAVNKEELGIYKERLHTISKDIEDSALREIKNMQSSLESESIGVQEFVGNKVDEALQQTLAEISAYREKKILEINNRMLSFLKDFTLRTVGTGLEMQQQEELILKALEEAKEGHVF